MHDARAWRLCELRQHIENDIDAYLPNNTHILGDGAYAVKQYMMSPYRDNGHLTETQSYFNLMHAKTRNVVERSFARLKGIWRRLNFILMYNTEKIPMVILAACVLHNICLSDEDDAFNDENFLLEPNDLHLNDEAEPENLEDDIDDIVGAQKRDAIAAQLFRNRRVLDE